MEDLLYELSVVGVFPPSSLPPSVPAIETAEGAMEEDKNDPIVPLAALEGVDVGTSWKKHRQRVTSSSTPPLLLLSFFLSHTTLLPLPPSLPPSLCPGIRLRLSSFDEHREVVIKACRDIQKSSKNAIYSTHRSDYSKARSLLTSARAGMKQALRPSLLLHPSLRHTGSVESAMEEFAEAVLFLIWREEGRLAVREEVGEGGEEVKEGGMEVTPIEYVGGLVDLTGEVGRFAVARATAREVTAVEGCLETVMYVAGELVRSTLPGKVNKKMEGLRTNQKKLETLRYELALIQAGKGTVGGMEGAKERGEGMKETEEE